MFLCFVFFVCVIAILTPDQKQDAHYMKNLKYYMFISPFFPQMTRGQRSGISSKATFVTLSRALCRHGILALFGISKLPIASDSSPSIKEEQQREEMIERFKIPRNASTLGGQISGRLETEFSVQSLFATFYFSLHIQFFFIFFYVDFTRTCMHIRETLS